MARTIQHMVKVKHAVQDLLAKHGLDTHCNVVSALSVNGPEVRVICMKGKVKEVRLKLPSQKIGVPIIVVVDTHDGD